MISVLLPSRGRPAALRRTVCLLLGLADDPDGVEVLVGADADDPETIAVARDLGLTAWVAETRLGYDQLHRYVNQLAMMASGTWLMLWNDDALMTTASWDTVVRRQAPGVLWPKHNDQLECNIFPVWPRSWTDAIGHVSLSPQCDSWMQEIGAAVGRQWVIDVSVSHETVRLTGEQPDQTFLDAQPGAERRTEEFGMPLYRLARQHDAAVVRGLLT